MFERYTERARRVIFFARYEASTFGSMTIETEHFLLGLIREDKDLTDRFLRSDSSALHTIRSEIEAKTVRRDKVSTSIDLPLSNECKRILAYANEEADGLKHRHIGTQHLLVGILREEKSIAAQILVSRGLRLEAVREEIAKDVVQADEGRSTFTPSTTGKKAPVDLEGLLTRLDSCGFSEAKGHLIAALDAAGRLAWTDARAELQTFFENLVDGIQEKLKAANVEFHFFEWLDWRTYFREFASGAPEEEHWKFKYQMVLLLADVLLKRFEQHLSS